MNLPIGSIILWADAVIPPGWQICNGTNGTPNLVGRFPLGASIDGDLLVAADVATHTHTNGSTGTRADHSHTGISGTSGGASMNNIYGGPGGGAASGHTHSIGSSVNAGNSHAHTIGNTDAPVVMPPYKILMYIMRMT